MPLMAIVVCESPLQDRGTVAMVGNSLLISFGMIQGTVSGYGVIFDRVTNHVFYLIENVSDGLKVGDSVRVGPSIHTC